MTHTFKTLLLGTAAVLTFSAGGAIAQDNYSADANVDATIQSDVNANQEIPSAPDMNARGSAAGGQQDEYTPTERNTRADAIGKSNDGTQSEMEADQTAEIDADVNSSDVENVQQALNEQGYTVSVDGVIGAETRNALKSFQASNNLSATGEINTQTLAALKISDQ